VTVAASDLIAIGEQRHRMWTGTSTLAPREQMKKQSRAHGMKLLGLPCRSISLPAISVLWPALKREKAR
jgi:hypothetical protein